jgi:hypothetical protein
MIYNEQFSSGAWPASDDGDMAVGDIVSSVTMFFYFFGFQHQLQTDSNADSYHCLL